LTSEHFFCLFYSLKLMRLYKGVNDMVKNQKGFTLVEVIVVAVIVAVLAAVAIPLYMGYIRDSRINVGNNVGGTLASAGGATTQQQLTVPAGTYASPDAPAAPINITFPSVGNDPANPNVVLIPNSFTAVLTAKTSVCYYTKYGANSGTVYTFAQ
jgi:prepilin-type N-terminal cleavage/methylation domain-containing protein